MSSTPFSLTRLPSKEALTSAFVGKPLSSLRTPALILDRQLFRQNCEKMASRVSELGISFRAHVKTHKTGEGVREQLKAGKVRGVVCSTLMECWGIIEEGIVDEGLLDDMLYGLPCGLEKIPDLHTLSLRLQPHSNLLLMIDHPDQIIGLETFNLSIGRTERWKIFIKVDGGGKRAGIPAESEEMFYSHFGQAYASRSESDAAAYLEGEVACANKAAEVALSLGLKPSISKPWVLSIGATPSAHVSQSLKVGKELHGVLELHAGNYPSLDLQQVATNLVPLCCVANSVLTRVISKYPHRDEALCDAGALAFSKDLGPFPGHGRVVYPPQAEGWELGRVSQEHGILTKRKGMEENCQELEIGMMLKVVGQHSCLILAGFPWYYVVDGEVEGGEEVVDVWVPWKGW